MPYSCEILTRDGRDVVLQATPEQWDCEPFYTSPQFALGLLLAEDDSALAAAVGGDLMEAFTGLAQHALDPTPYVATVSVVVEQRGSEAHARAPVARYAIRATDARWLAHLRPGLRFDSYAWDEHGDHLDDATTMEASAPLPVRPLGVGERVALRPDLPCGPGSPEGRGTIDATATTAKPAGWAGGDRVHRVVLDHGPVMWAFTETLRPVPDDTYERARREPDAFFTALLTEAPLDRARALRFLGLRGDGDLALSLDHAPPLDCALAIRSARMLGLLAALPIARAVAIATTFLADWAADEAACAQRFGRPVAGTELGAGDTIEAYQLELCCPIELTLGGLTLALDRARAAIPRPTTLPATLDAIISRGFGYPPDAWRRRTAYLRAACAAAPPPLPAWIRDGYPNLHELARQHGLAGGGLVAPIELDRIRP
jgi:hypothetical protein